MKTWMCFECCCKEVKTIWCSFYLEKRYLMHHLTWSQNYYNVLYHEEVFQYASFHLSTLLVLLQNIFFFSQRASCSQKTSLSEQWLWEISVEYMLRDSDRWAVVKLSYENMCMWTRVNIILLVTGQHKRKTVHLVRTTNHLAEWIFIIECCCF